jgi:cbb3-type cytochrome oxidase subunit 3
VADDSWKAITAVVLLIIAIAVIYFELRLMRRRREARASDDGLDDQAHNAIITTRAIASSMERGGVRSMEARELIRKAERAGAAGNSRAAIDYAASAREVLMKEKQRHRQMGDLIKLPTTETPPAAPEETTKEKLQKELPKNYLQAKFMLTFAQTAIDERVKEGGDVAEATRLLAIARKAFDEKDYDASLKHGVQARKAAEELVIEITDVRVTEVPGAASTPGIEMQSTTLACRSCGASLSLDDMFCRKCGVKVELAMCPSCGTKPVAGDAFCRKCGVALR